MLVPECCLQKSDEWFNPDMSRTVNNSSGGMIIQGAFLAAGVADYRINH